MDVKNRVASNIDTVYILNNTPLNDADFNSAVSPQFMLERCPSSIVPQGNCTKFLIENKNSKERIFKIWNIQLN